MRGLRAVLRSATGGLLDDLLQPRISPIENRPPDRARVGIALVGVVDLDALSLPSRATSDHGEHCGRKIEVRIRDPLTKRTCVSPGELRAPTGVDVPQTAQVRTAIEGRLGVKPSLNRGREKAAVGHLAFGPYAGARSEKHDQRTISEKPPREHPACLQVGSVSACGQQPLVDPGTQDNVLYETRMMPATLGHRPHPVKWLPQDWHS